MLTPEIVNRLACASLIAGIILFLAIANRVPPAADEWCDIQTMSCYDQLAKR